MNNKIIIFDTTLRDGEQSPKCSMTIEEKVKIAKKLEELGVDIIEAGFAASSSKDFEAIQEISKNVNKPIITALARLTENDIDKAAESLKYAKKKRIHIFIATSDIHIKDKLRITREEVINKTKEMVRYAKSKCEDIEFSLEDATRTNLEFMTQVIATAINSGATTINLADTVGFITPEEFKNVIEYLKVTVPNIDNIALGCHCHNDLNLATSNSLAAIESGVTQVECCVNGIGERAGNTALEQIVMALHVRKDHYKKETNIDISKLLETSKLVADIVNEKLERTKPVVGENVNIHSSGIHQDGILKNKDTYEIINFEELGRNNEKIKIDIHSGKAAIKYILNKHNIYPKEDIRDFVTYIKEYLKSNKDISEEEICDMYKNLKI